jgi:WD40 repeat protein
MASNHEQRVEHLFLPASSPFVAQEQDWERSVPDFVGALSPDGMHVAVRGPNHTVEVWNNTFSHRLLTYCGHQDGLYRRLNGHILSIAWSPDGTRIASVSSNGSLQVWDARTAIHQRTLLLATTEAMQLQSLEQECELIWETDGLHLYRQRVQEQEQRVWHL